MTGAMALPLSDSRPWDAKADRLATVGRYLLLFLTVFCAKLWVIRQYGNSVPEIDQWPGEAWALYKPYLEGNLTFQNLIGPHNEHHIFFPRLLFLLLLKINELWEPLLELVAQAVIHSATIVLFIALCVRSLPGPARVMCMAASALLWLFPFGWENTLMGFQSQFYFVALFGTCAIWLFWRHDSLSLGWWCGVLAACCGLYTMASGLFIPATGCVLTLVRLWGDRSRGPRHGLAFLLMVALAFYGYHLIPVEMRHGQYAATSIGQLLSAFLTTLSWPCGGSWCWLILEAPFALLAVALVRKRVALSDPAWLVLAFGVWGWMQAFATAYGRANLTLLAPRYLDTSCLTLCAALACLFLWVVRFSALYRRPWVVTFASLWIFTAALGAVRHYVTATSGELAHWSELTDQQGDTVAAYMETHDASLLTSKPIPFPEAEALKTWLDDPTVASFLPARLRTSLHGSREVEGFSTRSYFRNGGVPPPDDLRYWSSYGPENADVQRGHLELKFAGAPKSRWLEMFVSGHPGAKGMSLVLKDKNGLSHDLAPFRNLGIAWRPVLVKVPAGSFSIEAKDDSENAWLALSNPRQVGIVSALTERLSDFLLETFVPFMLACIMGLLTMVLLGIPERVRRSPAMDVICRLFTGLSPADLRTHLAAMLHVEPKQA